MTQAPALVLISTSFPISGDGSEAAGSFVSDLVEEISKYVPVRVVAPGPANARERWSSNVEVFRYATPARPLSTLKPWVPSQLAEILRVLRNGANATDDALAAGSTAVSYTHLDVYKRQVYRNGQGQRRVNAAG